MTGTWCRAYRNGIARIRSAHITTARSREYQFVAYRKTHPELKVVKAVTALLKAEEWYKVLPS